MYKVYYISGYNDLTQEEFKKHYIDKIDQAIKKESRFVVGDDMSTEYMALNYLFRCALKDTVLFDRIMVYHKGKAPRYQRGLFKTKKNFKTHDLRNSAMTNDSTHDILYIRTLEEQVDRAEKIKQHGSMWPDDTIPAQVVMNKVRRDLKLKNNEDVTISLKNNF